MVKVYVGTDGLHQDEFLRRDHPAALSRGNIAAPPPEAAIINTKYVNINPLNRIAHDYSHSCSCNVYSPRSTTIR